MALHRDQHEQPAHTTPQEPLGDLHVTGGALKAGDQLPAACAVEDLLKAFGRSRSWFYRMDRIGAFKRFELSRPVGSLRWSGKLVMDFLNGADRPVFGRRRSA